MQRLEVSGAVRPIYGSLGVKRLIFKCPEGLGDFSGTCCGLGGGGRFVCVGNDGSVNQIIMCKEKQKMNV